MCELKTLNEVCKTVGVTRRTIQGYEKEGLVIPTAKNKYGYLMYDAETVNRIALVKMYQDFGFQRKEIKVLLEAPKSEVKKYLERQVEKLKKELLRMESLIEKAKEELERLT